MRRFLTGRVLQAAGTLLLATFVLHTALALLPGDPIRALFGPARPDPGVYEALRAQYRFDEPWFSQYLLWLGDLVSGDWGHSFPGRARNRVVMGPPVRDILGAAVPVSARLLAIAVVVQTLAGIGAGVLAVSRRRADAPVYWGAVAFVATPVIVLAFAAQSVLGRALGWLPVAGLGGGWSSYVLPAATLSATAAAYVTLLTRAELGETLRERYVRAARARAIPTTRLLGLHALRPSLVPVIALVAANIGQLLTALVIVEGVFGIPGVGGTLFTAIQTRDQALLLGLLVFATAVVLVASLVADVLHVVVDPRARDAVTSS